VDVFGTQCRPIMPRRTGALSDTAICPSVCPCPRRAAALNYRHAGCLQLSHVRTADPDGRRSAASKTAIEDAVQDCLGNDSVPKIAINDTINLFLKNAIRLISILVISKHNSFRVLFDKLASVYFI